MYNIIIQTISEKKKERQYPCRKGLRGKHQVDTYKYRICRAINMYTRDLRSCIYGKKEKKKEKNKMMQLKAKLKKQQP